MRLLGTPELEDLVDRWFSVLPEAQARQVIMDLGRFDRDVDVKLSRIAMESPARDSGVSAEEGRRVSGW